MARYAEGHKDATRRRILDAAGRRLKATGIDGSGVALLMKDAGLTNGAFYAHFASKEDLVAAVVADQLRAQTEVLVAAVEATGGLGPIVQEYLGRGHRDDTARGCPSAALLAEVARGPEAVRQAYADGLSAQVEALAAVLRGGSSPDLRPALAALLGQLAGTLQMARAMRDDATADGVLEAGRRAAEATITQWSQGDDDRPPMRRR